MTTGRALGQDDAEQVKSVLKLKKDELENLFRQGAATPLPPGKVRGYPIPMPGRPIVSRAGRAFWQGKIVDPEAVTLVNRFFGVRMIKGRILSDASWFDGAPALIVDYSQTSWIYGRYRDEIRRIGPNLWLGLMFNIRDQGADPKPIARFLLQVKPDCVGPAPCPAPAP